MVTYLQRRRVPAWWRPWRVRLIVVGTLRPDGSVRPASSPWQPMRHRFWLRSCAARFARDLERELYRHGSVVDACVHRDPA